MKALPVGIAYSVWVGVGAVGSVILGIVLFGEAATAARLVSVAFHHGRHHRSQARDTDLTVDFGPLHASGGATDECERVLRRV